MSLPLKLLGHAYGIQVLTFEKFGQSVGLAARGLVGGWREEGWEEELEGRLR